MAKMENFFSLKNSGKSWLNKIYKFLLKPYGFALVLIIILASFMRLYKISEYMTFLGDEGRDAIVAKEILEGNLTLLGPRASAGDFFLGPIYYYMIAPFLALFNYDPVGPAVMVALLGVGTVFLIYYFTQLFFGKKAGLIAAFLYSISPIVIAFSRSSWNPNPVPFFTMLLMLSIYFSVKKNSLKLSIISGILIGILLQLHYISTFIGVIVFAFVLVGNFLQSRKKIIGRYVRQYSSLLIGFLVSFSPFLLFELRHGLPNLNTIFRFIFIDNYKQEGVKILSHHEIILDVFFRLYSRLILNYPPPEQLSMFSEPHLWSLQIMTISLILASVIALFLQKNKLLLSLLSIWLFVGIFLFGFYKKEIYDYYYGFLFPLPFILIGNMIRVFLSKKDKLRLLSIVGILIFLSITLILLLNNPFQYQGNNQKREAENIARKVIEVTDGKPYNFALITAGNSDHVFRYFLEVYDREPVVIENVENDPQRNTVTDQLIVICDHKCQPIGHPLWEVAGFGRAEIAGQWEVPFVTIYKLIKYDGQD